YYVCHNTHILVKGKMKKDEKNEEKKRMNPWFYAIFWLSRQKLATVTTFLAMDPGLITGFAMQLAFGSLHGDQNRHALDELRRRSDQRPLFLRHGKVHDQVCNR